MHPDMDMMPDEEFSEEELQQQLAERLHVFAGRLSQLAAEQAGKRVEIENRWLDDLRQFHGEYGPDEKARLQMDGGSQVFVNITRNKTNAAEARLQDMLFPTDDRNWGIRPTPNPDMEEVERGTLIAAPDDGSPMDLSVITEEILRESKKRAEAMQTEIDDQLVESRYQIKARDIIHDACQLGTGIFKGPVITSKMKKQWQTLQNGVSILNMVQDLRPSVERVDPWDFFPDMSACTVEDAEFFFERRRLSKKQLRELARLPGILVEQLRLLVAGDARTTHLARNYQDDIRNITGINTVGEGNKYELWEYHGPISKSELMDAFECCEHGYEAEEIDALDDEVDAIVLFAGNHVLKVTLNPMDTTEHPYSVFNWEKDESCIFGFGVPALMRNPQRVINASWRMMMDNAGLSVSDQIIVNRELVAPADGEWRIKPKKMWYLKDKTRNVNEVFAAFSTQSHQQELGNVFQMARQLADEETNLPLIAQGEQTQNITKTSSGMSMLMNSANIVLRRAVKNWDDDITRPLITRFYDWNMQFSPKPEIKGDYCIDARGSGALLVREKQQENLMIYANISAGNPELAMRRDWKGIDKEIAKALEVPYENITLPDGEIEEKQAAMQQQPDPAAMAAQMEMQIKQAELQLEQQKLQLQAQMEQSTMQLKERQAQAEMQMEHAKLMQQRELKLAEIAARANMTQAQLEARMAIDGQKIQTDREKAAGDLNIKTATAQMQAQNIANKFDTF